MICDAQQVNLDFLFAARPVTKGQELHDVIDVKCVAHIAAQNRKQICNCQGFQEKEGEIGISLTGYSSFLVIIKKMSEISELSSGIGHTTVCTH